MRSHAYPALVILGALAAVLPAPVAAQDTTPPQLTAVQVDAAPERNGDPIIVSVDAAADEPARFEVTCTYASSYPRFGDAALSFWLYKTAAVGDHTGATIDLATSVADLEVLVGPRCYHADTLTVSVVAVDGAGNRSEPAVAHHAAIDVPYPAPRDLPGGDHYAVAVHWNGSARPSDHNLATIEDWAEPDLAFCTDGFIFEGPQTDPDWDHWVERMRDVPGSNNQAVVGFSTISARPSNDLPVQARLHAFLMSVHDEVDDNILVHLVDGSLAYVDGDADRILLNVFNETARDTFAWFLAQEWNHCENRAPRVGLMFDVYELWTDYQVGDQWAAEVIDRDRDGIPLLDDPDELVGSRLGRIDLLRSVRRHIAATSTDPAVGRYFLLGANTVSGRSDGEMLAELDFLMLESIQCSPGSSTEFQYYDGDGCYGEHVATFPYHGAASEDFTREFCPGIYYDNHLLEAGILPNPADLSQAWEDLPAAMRADAGGPFLAPESQSFLNTSPVHPGTLEALCLLFDHFYPVWHRQDDLSWPRQFWHPSREGLPSLHALGRATSAVIRDRIDEDVLYWRRQYEHGSVEVVIADTTVFSCEAGDRFDYRVTAGGQVLRQSDSWGPPDLETFFVAGWDSSGVGGTLRMDLTAVASEPVRWQRSLRVGDSGPWSEPAPPTDRDQALAGYWDTGLPPQTGSLWVRVRGLDQTGQATDWAKREVPLQRFGGYGVIVEDTHVYGTAYGLPLPDGGYEVLGVGDNVPELAPPHYLEIRGTAPAGFTPVEVRWRNSLGGEGVAEGTSPWRVLLATLHRGTNVYTITCVAADGTARVGSLTMEWDFPGRPGRR